MLSWRRNWHGSATDSRLRLNRAGGPLRYTLRTTTAGGCPSAAVLIMRATLGKEEFPPGGGEGENPHGEASRAIQRRRVRPPATADAGLLQAAQGQQDGQIIHPTQKNQAIATSDRPSPGRNLCKRRDGKADVSAIECPPEADSDGPSIPASREATMR